MIGVPADFPPPANADIPSATVVITTKNRKADLAGAIKSVLAQRGNVECLVVDDASTDGTADMVRSEFPSVRLEVSPESRGYIVQRNLGAQLARGKVIFSIDDDAIFSTPDVVQQTLEDFDHPAIGAVAIPFINVNQDDVLRQRALDTAQRWIAPHYIGTAHAIRRDVFLQCGQYRGELIHQGEERDLSIRMINAGYFVRLGRADPIHHFESPKRNFERMARFGRRNDVLFAWQNVPLPWTPIYTMATTLNGLRFLVGSPDWRAHMAGLTAGYRSILGKGFPRRPVSGRALRTYRMLVRKRQVRLESLVSGG
ncbi:MAG TPA: glycosyltransferase family 2 protein [Tepidisphaeraceae bacterium]|jgi:glycosyltransferase involved in cell wall biosynthesis